MKKHIIITGASRGIGDALATLCEQQGHEVLRIARTLPEDTDNGLKIDLTEKDAHFMIKNWLQQHKMESVALINNAGTVEPIGKVGQLCHDQLETAIALNLSAPIRLSNLFTHLLQDLPIDKRIMNISSGAGRSINEGWSIYGMTKCGLDHFTQTAFAEQLNEKYPIQFVSIAPGIIQTNMQAMIRQSSVEQFPDVERFIKYDKQNALATPEETAARLLDYLWSEKMGTQPLADIRHV